MADTSLKEPALANRTNRTPRLVWVLAGGAFLAMLAGSLLWGRVSLPPQADAYLTLLRQGMLLVRVALVAALALSGLCAWARWPGVGTESARRPDSYAPQGIRLHVILILLVAMLLRLPNLFSGFAFDELSLMVRQVARGLPVVVAFTGDCQTHVLTGILAWASTHFLGNGEAQARLPMFVLGILTPVAAYVGMARISGIRAAGWTAWMLVLNTTLVVNSSAARGYAGIAFCAVVSCWLFVEILRGHGRWPVFGYMIAAATSYGFVMTSVMLPIAHGFVAGLGWLYMLMRHGSGDPRTWRYFNALLAVVWSGVLALILFGLPLPQILAYAKTHVAINEQLYLGWILVRDMVAELSGCRVAGLGLGWVLLGLAGLAWAPMSRDIRLSFGTPVALCLAWLLMPGQLFNGRIFIFLLPAFSVGVAQWVVWWERKSLGLRALAYLGLSLWMVGQAPILKDHLWVGNPDLKGLARRLKGQHVMLVGPQADLNSYYFGSVPTLKYGPKNEEEWRQVTESDVVVYGCDWPIEFTALNEHANFELEERLPTWRPGHISFWVYRKAE